MKDKLYKALVFIPMIALLATPVLGLAADQQPGSKITSLTQVEQLLGGILGWLTSFLYIAAAIMVIIAGFTYLGSQGDEEKVKKAKNMLIYAVIAVALGLVAGGIGSLVDNILSSGTTPNVAP